MLTALFLEHIHTLRKYAKASVFLHIILLAAFLTFLLRPGSDIWKRVDRQKDFTWHYGHYLEFGEGARILAGKNGTLFINDYDSLIFWQANVRPAYKRQTYYPIMEDIALLREEKAELFRTAPPTLYYDRTCNVSEIRVEITGMPEFARQDYLPVMRGDSPICLFVRKEQINLLTEEDKQALDHLKFWLPKTQREAFDRFHAKQE